MTKKQIISVQKGGQRNKLARPILNFQLLYIMTLWLGDFYAFTLNA